MGYNGLNGITNGSYNYFYVMSLANGNWGRELDLTFYGRLCASQHVVFICLLLGFMMN